MTYMIPEPKSIIKYILTLPVFVAMLATGAYKLYGEDVVKATAREVAIDVVEHVADSLIIEQEKSNVHQQKQLKILHNYMMLQNKDLYEQAKELENN